MLQLNSKTFWIYTALTVTLSAVTTYSLMPKQIEYKEKIITKVQERVKTHTKIVESPDGTKVTIIDQDSRKDSEVVAERQSKPSSNKWVVSATMTSDSLNYTSPTWGIGVSRNLILGLSGGVYGTTDGQLGLIVNYSF